MQVSQRKRPGRLASPRRRREIFWGYLFIAPTVLGLMLFLIGPIFYSLFMSLYKWDNLNPPVYIAFDNFKRLMGDASVLAALWHTVLFTFTIIPLSIIVSLVVANALSKNLPGTAFFRSAFFTPYVTLAVAAALVWQSMFNSRFGPVNSVLAAIGIKGPAWLTDPSWVRVVIVMMGVWGRFGYQAILLLAGIKSISPTYYEAAAIDGARPWQAFRRITLPLLTPQIFFLLITGLIDGFKMFDAVYIFGKTDAIVRDGIRTLVYGIFEHGFTFMEMGYASAEALFLFLLIMAVTVVQFVGQRRWVIYDT